MSNTPSSPVKSLKVVKPFRDGGEEEEDVPASTPSSLTGQTLSRYLRALPRVQRTHETHH